ncbi:MAG: hypothetical protein ACK4UJ_12340 [Leptonema sp. (in: bacteria)]
MPYSFLLKKFELNLDTNQNFQRVYSDNFLYIEGLNHCFEYQFIFATPLESPFLYGENSKENLLFEKQFFWIRVYLKNITETKINIKSVYLEKEEKIFPYNVELSDFIETFSIYLNHKPIFWYLLPKDPSLYFLDNNSFSDWWNDFYTSIFYPKYNTVKIQFYKKFFDNPDFFEIKQEEEVLYFLIFPNFKEDFYNDYRFIADWNHCKIEIPFRYKLELVNEYKPKKESEEILNQLRNQNIKWENKLKNQLEQHDF